MRLGFGVTGVGNCSLIRSSSRGSVNFRGRYCWVETARDLDICGQIWGEWSRRKSKFDSRGLDSWRVSADTEGSNSQYRVTEKPNKSLFGFFLHVISPKDAS
jgi:hypothetical protein